MPKLKKLAIGQSDICAIIEDNCIYVDKTKQVYDLIEIRSKYFLSRPRRFGKSTLISTFYEIFRGNRELFKDQWIYNSPWSWDEYPIIRIDFNAAKNADVEYHIIDSSKLIANEYNVELDLTEPYYLIFKHLIINLYTKYQTKVVVLIDEYDKPILDVIEDVELAIKNRDILMSFYGIMKGVDQHLRFVFLTGVTRLSRASVFSGLNNLDDISMDENYATICGITQDELGSYFSEYVDSLATKTNMTREDCLAEIKHWYNGFYFSQNLELSVYNPFSTLLLFDSLEFSNYWFSSGSPTFLIKLIKKNKQLNLVSLDKVELYEEDFNSFEIDDLNLNAILLQAGYLTIKGYNKYLQSYTLGYTNYEIEKSFKSNLFSSYFIARGYSSHYLLDIYKGFDTNDLETVIISLKQIFINLDYDIIIDKEKSFQNIIYLIFQLLGFYVKVEYKTNIGRINAIVLSGDNVYIFEFKINKNAKDALAQIHEKQYYNRFVGQNKKIYLIGMNYDTKTKIIDDYLLEELDKS